MNSGKVLALAAFGAAIALLFTTKRGKELRKDMANAAEDWGETLGELAEKATVSAKDLKKLVSKEISGLSDEARERISTILDEGGKSGKKLKKLAEAGLN
jgi:gas vesicle protein